MTAAVGASLATDADRARHNVRAGGCVFGDPRCGRYPGQVVGSTRRRYPAKPKY